MPVRRHIDGPPLLRPRSEAVRPRRPCPDAFEPDSDPTPRSRPRTEWPAVRQPHGIRLAGRVRSQACLDTPGEIGGPEVPRADSRLRPLEQRSPAVWRQAHIQIVTGIANGSDFLPRAIDPDESRDVRVRVIRDRSGAGCGEHRSPSSRGNDRPARQPEIGAPTIRPLAWSNRCATSTPSCANTR